MSMIDGKIADCLVSLSCSCLKNTDGNVVGTVFLGTLLLFEYKLAYLLLLVALALTTAATGGRTA